MRSKRFYSVAKVVNNNETTKYFQKYFSFNLLLINQLNNQSKQFIEVSI